MLAERYRLESRIAFGGVGEVWRATDVVLGRAVAVKLLRDGHADHPEVLARFREEARHAGSVVHPGIAQVYDYGEAIPPHSPYLVMELVDGPSLAGLLAAGPLGPARTMDIVAQAAAGLAAAHSAGLVHRDIKPANLLLTSDGTVKITDFGLARAADSMPLTLTGALVGTPAYLAPERASGASATPATDLYSLGVVAYECLAGAPPFDGTPLEMVAAHQRRPLPLLPAAVPAEVATLITHLTSKDPAARPASAAAVAARAARLKDTGGDPAPTVAAAGLAAAAVPGPRDGAAEAPAPAGTAAGDATLAGMPLPVPPPRRASRWRERFADRRAALSGRATTLALAAVAIAAGLAIAGLTGWLLASGGSHAPRRGPAAGPPHASSSPPHRPHHHRPPPPAGRHDDQGQPGHGNGGPGPGDGGPGPGDGHGSGHGGDGNGQGEGG
jgi:serine/threonine-protein kinase